MKIAIKREDLLSKKDYFMSQVQKRIYITGPKKSLLIKDILLNNFRDRFNYLFNHFI